MYHPLGDFESIVKLPDKFRDGLRTQDGNRFRHAFDEGETWNQLVVSERTTGLPRLQLLLPQHPQAITLIDLNAPQNQTNEKRYKAHLVSLGVCELTFLFKRIFWGEPCANRGTKCA